MTGATPARANDGPARDAPRHWAAALGRIRDEVNPAVAALTADGVALAAVTAALRRVGPSFEQHCSRMPLVAQDRWAAALVRATIRALAARQWSDRTVVPWAVTELLPRLATRLPDLDDGGGGAASAEGTSERGDLVAELVHAADEVWRHGDVAMWGRLLLAAADTSSGPEGRKTLSADEIRDIGVVAAWRAGHVRMRTAAHRVGPRMADGRLARALDVTDGALAREALAANAVEPASWLPDEAPPASTPRTAFGDSALRTVGGFSGFGGPFRVPVDVISGDGLRWRLRERPSGDHPEQQREWDLVVDVHGAWLAPAASAASAESAATTQPPPATAGATGSPGHPAYRRTVSGRTVLVTSPHSHLIVHARAKS